MNNKPLKSSQVEALRFLSSIVQEIRDIAQGERLKMVAYFLEMAYLEIGDAIREDHARYSHDRAADTRERKTAA